MGQGKKIGGSRSELLGNSTKLVLVSLIFQDQHLILMEICLNNAIHFTIGGGHVCEPIWSTRGYSKI